MNTTKIKSVLKSVGALIIFLSVIQASANGSRMITEAITKHQSQVQTQEVISMLQPQASLNDFINKGA